jgi:hypothetical protein
MKRLAICSGVLGVFLFTLAVAPANAGTNMSNGSGTNTSNSTGTNTSNNTGTNTSNNTGGNTSNQQGYNSQILLRARRIFANLRTAQASGNQKQINIALSEAKEFLASLKQPQQKFLQQETVRSRQAW